MKLFYAPKLSKPRLYYFCLLVLLVSCKKNGADINTVNTDYADVYVAGISADTSIYWKNGMAAGLGGASNVIANSIAVSGSDVFIAGELFINGNYVAALWKNGTAMVLADQSKSPLSY